MVIPIYLNPEFKVGDIIVSLTEITLSYCKFSLYHEFTIIDYDSITGYAIRDNEAEIELTISSSALKTFTIKTDIKTSKNRYINIENKKKFINFIDENCPNKSLEWGDYDRYDACKLKYCYNDSCEVEENCIRYISNDIINKNSNIVKYIRSKKLKKLNVD
jgi:hypothetical protein